jgi:glycosyltransferase involved in cell wall biosynthesis
MTRVIHVTQPTTAGVAAYVRALARLQRDHGVDVVVVSPADGDLRGWLRADNTPWLSWPARREPHRDVLGEIRRLRRLVPRESCDARTVIHLHSSKAGLVGRLAFRHYPARIIFQPHGWSFLAASPAQRALALRWERHAASSSDVIVAVSAAEADLAREHRITPDCVVIPNAVKVRPLVAGNSARRRDARQQLGIDSCPTAVCVGRLSTQKGQDLLLTAWPEVIEAVPDAQLYLLGEGPLRPALEARGTPGVHFPGWVSDVDPWLDAADVAAAPSRWEGMSLGVLECLAAGRSVVATDVEGMRELLLEHATAGAVVAPEDTAGLAGALSVRLLDPELADREGAEGRRTVEAFYSVSEWERSVLALLEIRQ